MTDSRDLYVCTECEWVTSAEPSGAIGTAHAHAETHVGRWGLPAWVLPVAEPDKLDECIERATVVLEDGDRS